MCLGNYPASLDSVVSLFPIKCEDSESDGIPGVGLDFLGALFTGALGLEFWGGRGRVSTLRELSSR